MSKIELVNPTIALIKALELAGHVVTCQPERTCTSETCNCFSHDSGYMAGVVTPDIEVLAVEYWPGEKADLELWKLQDRSEVVVRRDHGNPSSFGAVGLLKWAGGTRPTPYWVRVAQASYDAACEVHADVDLAEPNEDGQGGGYWTCGSTNCSREPSFPVELVLDRLHRASDEKYGVEP